MANSFAFMIPLTRETKSKSRVSFKLDITLAKCKVMRKLCLGLRLCHQLCESSPGAASRFRALCLRMVTCCRDRNLKPQSLIGRHVAVVNENRDLKHQDGRTNDGVPEANFCFLSCAVLQYLTTAHRRSHVDDVKPVLAALCRKRETFSGFLPIWVDDFLRSSY